MKREFKSYLLLVISVMFNVVDVFDQIDVVEILCFKF